MTAVEEQARLSVRAMAVAAICALAGIAVLLSLAQWQANRAKWKEGLIADLSQRLAAAPTELPSPDRWPDLKAETSEFVRVRIQGEALPHEAFVYTTGSSLRPDVRGVGYWVFVPVRLRDGSIVVVNRGFVPEGRQDAKTRPAGHSAGQVDLVGSMRWPEARGLFTPNDNPSRNLWFVRDQLAIAAEKGWGDVAPFYVEQEAPPASGGFPQVGRLVPDLPNNHRQYEITWAGLALVLAGVFSVFGWRWYRAGAAA
jgi:surfeit locus 1 family protein